jgi:hypothetical protein
MLKISLILVCLVSFAAQAQSTAKKDNLDELFEAMQMDVMMDTMFSQMEDAFNTGYEESDLSSEELAIFKKYQGQTTEIMKNELSWEAMSVDIKQVYRQNFTEQEIADILAFYQSPAGQSVLRTMPVVMQESMQIGQNLAQSAMPKLQAISEKKMAELRELRESRESQE